MQCGRFISTSMSSLDCWSFENFTYVKELSDVQHLLETARIGGMRSSALEC
jgi:hypothetical protein